MEATFSTTNEAALQLLIEALSTSSGPPFSDLLEATEVANAAGGKLYRCTTPWLDGFGRLTLPAPPPPPPPPVLTSSGLYLPDFVNVTNVASKALGMLLQASAATINTAVTVAATAAVAAGAGAAAAGGAAGGGGPSGAVNALTQAQRLGAFGKLGGPPEDGDDGGGGGWTTGRLNFASRSDSQRRRRLAKGGGGGGKSAGTDDGGGGGEGGDAGDEDPISEMLIVAMLDTIYSVLSLFGIVVVLQYMFLVYWRLFANRKYYAWKPPTGTGEVTGTNLLLSSPPASLAASLPITSEPSAPLPPSPPSSPPQEGKEDLEDLEGGMRKDAKERDDADADGDNNLNFAEFCVFVRAREKNRHHTEAQLRSRFTALDLNGNGYVDMSEYVQFALRDTLGRDAARVMALFRSWDMDKTGWLDKKEFYAAILSLGFDATQQDSDAVFDALDDDGSGKLTFFECFGSKKKADKQRLMKEAALEAKKLVQPKFKSLPAILAFPTLEKFMLITFSPALLTASTAIIGAEVGGAHTVGTEAVVLAAFTVVVILIWLALEISTLVRFRRRHHDVCWQAADPPQVFLTCTAMHTLQAAI